MAKTNKVEFLTQIEKVQGESEGPLKIKGFANTVNKDRAGDVILPDAWKGNALKNYLKNPIILFNHDYSKPIGKMVDYNISDMGLEITAEIDDSVSEYKLIKNGILRTFSVGFYIKDADYEHNSDTLFIKELELLETSVVSVPCNQDSVFSLTKSIGEEGRDSLIKQFSKSEPKENIEMSDLLKDLEARLKNLEGSKEAPKQEPTESIADAVSKALAAEKQREAEEKAAKQAQEAREKELEEKLLAKLAASNKNDEVLDSVTKLVSDVKTPLEETIKSLQEKLDNQSEEIRSIGLARKVGDAGFKLSPENDVNLRKSIEDAYLVSAVLKKPIEQTKAGQAAIEKVNTSSSVQVSSDSYETYFSTNLLRDIQDRLVVQPLFREITLNQANMTIPIQPNAANASWVSAATYGTDATTGAEITAALTEINLQTHKLAGKSYLTDETEEDTIIAMLPLIRQGLVEAHAREVDNALLNSTGASTFKGLIQLATDDTTKVATTAKADGTVKVTAKMLMQGRRQLGKYGINVRDVALVVSQEAYWDLLEDDEFANISDVGAAKAVKLSGQVGSVYGMPVIVSDTFPAPAVSTAYAVLVNATNFLMPRQRNAVIQTDYDVEKQRRVLVATQRLGFHQLIGGKGVAALTYAAV